MKYLRYAILWEIYLILTALATLASYYLNFPFLHVVGFIYNLFPIKYYIGTSVWSVQYYSLYNFIQTFPLIYLGVIFISSNTSYMVRKLNIVGVFLIMGGLLPIINVIITMIMASGPPTRANYDNVQLISTIIQMAYLVVLLLIILILLFIRVKTNSQRFYKWFLIIYPALMMFLVYRVFTILLIYLGLNNGISPDLLLQYSVIITAASSVVSSVLYLILLVGLRNIDVPDSEQTAIKELSYPQATI